MKASHKPIHGPRRSSLPGASLGLRARRTGDLIREIEHGLPFRALQSLSRAMDLPVARIASLLELPERTLARRRGAGRLASTESERLLRLSRIFEKAVDLFEGNTSAAVSWLTAPRKALGESTPLAYSRTEPGAREVENLMGRLQHGVFS